MPRYAVEIGKVVLKSDRPITEEQREMAVRSLFSSGSDKVLAKTTVGDCEIAIEVRR